MPTGLDKFSGTSLKRELSLIDVIAITAGSMISSGLFVIPGIAFARTGPSVILSYLLAALIALPTMLSAAELATAMPKAGGVYFFVNKSMGLGLGAIAGFARWFSISLKSSFALIGIGVYSAVFTGINPTYISVTLCLLFIVINLRGVRLVGKTQTLLTAFLMAVLLFISLWGLTSVSTERFVPFAPYGSGTILATAGYIFISYGGMLSITGLAEEVQRPKRNIPLGMLLALGLTGIVYALVIFVVIGTLEPDVLQGSLTPVADGAATYLDRNGVILTTIAALLAFITTANAGIASASRYPYAMSRDRLVPSFFQNTTQAHIPYVSILFTGVFILAAIICLKLELLVEVASSLLMLTYILTNFAVIIMRKQNNDKYRPSFRAPLLPWLQLFSIAGLLLLLFKTGILSLLFSLILIAGSYIWYRYYILRNINRKGLEQR